MHKKLTVIAIFLTLAGASRAASSGPQPQVHYLKNSAPGHVLFVGNSYLYYGDSLHNHVRRIAEELGPPRADTLKYKSATIGGARLSHHNLDSLLEPSRLGLDQPFELVILQGGSGEVLTAGNRARFRQSATELDKKIRATGAQVALYMTHAYVPPHKKFDPDMINKITQTYISVGNELGALVIPVGLAFDRAYKQRPDIKLHKSFDGTHPGLLGTYLAACVVYQSVYGIPVTNSSYDYFGEIGRDDAVFLRQIADETVRTFFDRQHPAPTTFH